MENCTVSKKGSTVMRCICVGCSGGSNIDLKLCLKRNEMKDCKYAFGRDGDDDYKIKKSNEGNHKVLRNNISLGLLNVRSLTPRVDNVHELISEGFDIFVATETWHGSSDDICIKLAKPPGYCFVDYLRPGDTRHGGLIVFFRTTFKFVKIKLPSFESFESVALKLFLDGVNISLLALYRPGSTLVTSLFFQELASALEYVTTIGNHVIIAGDFNLHIEKTDNHQVKLFFDILESFNVSNIVNQPTHTLGGTLDLVLASSNLPVSSCIIEPSGVYSDHSLVRVKLSVPRVSNLIQTKLVRSWSRMNRLDFIERVMQSPIYCSTQFDDVDAAMNMFYEEITNIINVVAPQHLVKSKYVPSAPWFDNECRVAKRFCRKKERQYRSCLNETSKSAWILALKSKNKLYADKRGLYWRNIIKTSGNNSKKIWTNLNKILCKDNGAATNENTMHTANEFLTFFKNKVIEVQSSTSGSEHPVFEPCACEENNFFLDFAECSAQDVRTILMSSSSTNCLLDVLPTHLLKEHIDLFLPFLTHLINSCLKSGRFPSICRHAIVTPRLKNKTLDINDIKNFRPVSNLSFISKLIERVVTKQLLNYLHSFNLLPRYQSGYRCYHSTETALLEVVSNLFESCDASNVSLLALLDMSAAFDCVNHDTLLKRLFSTYGIRGKVALWFESYLSGRTQQVLFKNILSSVDDVSSGVPQGSVLGPVLFLLYTADVLGIIENFGFKGHAYADDIQIIASGTPESFNILCDRLLGCLSDVDEWMAKNSLKLNQCKTQLLPVGTWQQLSKINCKEVVIKGINIKFCSSAKNLGFIFDSVLSIYDHIKSLASVCSFQLRMLRLIKRFLDENTVLQLVHSFIYSRLDYNNSLFFGVSERGITLLQSIQNRAARLVVGTAKYDHITPVLRTLHWLTMEKRVVFKICLLAYKCVNGLAPQYLIDRFAAKKPSHLYALRSNDSNPLVVPITRLKIGSRNFAVTGPMLWNKLPMHLRRPGLSMVEFKKDLKTYLFDM